MDDVKTTSANDNNAAKTMALDHLGLIAARLRTTAKKFGDSSSRLLPLDDVLTLMMWPISCILTRFISDPNRPRYKGFLCLVRSPQGSRYTFVEEVIRRSGLRGTLHTFLFTFVLNLPCRAHES